MPKVLPQHSLHKHTLIVYGKKEEQQITNSDNSKLLLENQIKTIQSITESFLCHARGLDYAILLALNKILCVQAKLIQFTKEQYYQIIDYATIYPQVCI